MTMTTRTINDIKEDWKKKLEKIGFDGIEIGRFDTDMYNEVEGLHHFGNGDFKNIYYPTLTCLDINIEKFINHIKKVGYPFIDFIQYEKLDRLNGLLGDQGRYYFYFRMDEFVNSRYRKTISIATNTPRYKEWFKGDDDLVEDWDKDTRFLGSVYVIEELIIAISEYCADVSYKIQKEIMKIK